MAIDQTAPASYLTILDRAIVLLETRVHFMSCVAFWTAFCESPARAEEMPVYAESFEKFAKSKSDGAKPAWWGTGGPGASEARLAMVRAYRASLRAN